MARRTDQTAELAAQAASDAARVLQARQQESRSEPRPEPANEPPKEDATSDRPRPAPRNDVRRQAMEEIEARDLQSKGDMPAAPKASTPENPAPPTPDAMLAGGKFTPPPAEEPAAVPPVVEAPPAVEMVHVKVDGEEFDVPKTEVDAAGGVTAYQKDRASDNRLKKANEALAEVRRVQTAMVEWQRQQPPKPPDLTNEQFIASKMDVIRFGTPEESAVAMREIIERSNPRIDQNALTQRAVSEMQRSMATQEFQKEFQDVVANPLLLRLAATLEQERSRTLNGPVNWSTFYRQIGNEVRSVRGPSQPAPSAPAVNAAPAAPAGSTSAVPDKEARKASIVNLPTAAARAALPEADKPETREDTLNQMRKTRGIPIG